MAIKDIAALICVVVPLTGAVLAVWLALFWLLYGAVSELRQMYQRWLDGR